jgi:hypothetical protein
MHLWGCRWISRAREYPRHRAVIRDTTGRIEYAPGYFRIRHLVFFCNRGAGRIGKPGCFWKNHGALLPNSCRRDQRQPCTEIQATPQPNIGQHSTHEYTCSSEGRRVSGISRNSIHMSDLCTRTATIHFFE